MDETVHKNEDVSKGERQMSGYEKETKKEQINISAISSDHDAWRWLNLNFD